jgi:hypothetical protein
MERVITFRPTEEVAAIIQHKRDEGCNVSAWINQSLMLLERKQTEALCRRSVRIIPVERASFYKSIPCWNPRDCATPVGQLSIKPYKEYLDLLQSEGLQLHRFRIDADHTMSVISVNREEASMEFTRYFSRSSADEPYVRTSLPLPVIYYDRANHAVLIEQYEI